LGRYLPAFGKLTALVQHEFYHLYTADEHTLVCLEKLDAVRGALGGALGPYATLFQKVARPGLLYLALLLHDTGKAARSRNHVENSARIAQSVAGQLGLDAQGASTLVLLVRHHLAMAQTSQRRDLEDPAEIRRMAGLVETEENLNMLTLLTYVDTVATSDQLWNGFKEALLWTLHYRVRDLLRGQEESTQAQARRRERLAAEVGAQAPSTLREDEIQAHIAGLPQRYFWLRSAREIIADLELAHRFLRLQVLGREHHLTPVIAWHHETERGYSQLKVCAWDRHGLFCTIAGALTAAGLNILSADIFTREDHVVVDSFIVTDALTATAVNATQRQRAEHILKEALIGTVDLAEAVQRRQRVALPYAVPESERLRTIVRFNNESSETRTLIDVETEDRVGLLYGLSQALSAMQLDISLAKICTEKGAAMDTFYVSELAGGKLLDPARQEQVRSALCAAIERLER
jgi:[protein-PII] uridylyltransferase